MAVKVGNVMSMELLYCKFAYRRRRIYVSRGGLTVLAMLAVGKVVFNQYCASCSVCGTPFMPLPENRIMGDPGCRKIAAAITLVFGKVPFETWPGHRLSVLIGWFVVVIVPPRRMRDNALKYLCCYHSYPL